MPSPRLRWPLLLTLLLAGHVVFGAVRLPGKVWGERLADIQAYHQQGAPRFFLATEHLHGAAAIEWLLANTAPDSAVVWRGDSKGALEFAQPLLWPRLLIADPAHPLPDGRYEGRPLARLRQQDGSPGPVLALVGERTDLRLEAR